MNLKDKIKGFFGFRATPTPIILKDSPKPTKMSELTEQDISEIHKGVPKVRFLNTEPDYSTVGTAYDEMIYDERNRSENYKNYNTLDETSPEASTAIDAIRDNVAYDKFLNTFTFKSSDKGKKVQAAVEELNKIVAEYVPIFSRQMPKMGDSFWSVVLANITNDKFERTKRVKRLLNLPPQRVIRIEDEYGELKDFYFVNNIEDFENENSVINASSDKAKKIDKNKTLHFRIRDEYKKYGRSILFSSITATRKLNLAEDATLIQMVESSPSRLAWYIDVAHMAGKEAVDYVDDYKKLNEKRRVFGRDGKVKYEINALLPNEDLYVPSGKNSENKVEKLYREVNLSSHESIIRHFHNKTLASYKVPRSFLSFEVNISSKAVVVEQTIEFGKTCYSLQKEIVRALFKLARIVFDTYNIDIDDIDLRVELPKITVVDDLRKWQVEVEKARVVETLANYYPLPYVTKYVYGLTDEELKQLFVELKHSNTKEELAKYSELIYQIGGGKPEGSSDIDFVDKQDQNRDRARDIASGNYSANKGEAQEGEVDLFAMMEKIDNFFDSTQSELSQDNFFDLE